jgi:hypothetical protein
MVADFDSELGSIRFNQGDANKACGNIFTLNGHSLTSPNYNFQYHFKINSPGQEPYNISSNITPSPEYRHLCEQIGVENPYIDPDNHPVEWNDILLNDYNMVATSLETSKSIYISHGYDNLLIDWETYFGTEEIPEELEEQVGLIMKYAI